MKNLTIFSLKLFSLFAAVCCLALIISCSGDEEDPANSGEVNANFIASSQNITAGGTVTFTSTSTGALLQQWNFEGGTPTFSDQQNPEIGYTTPGSYTVTLTIFGEDGTDTETKENFITVTEGDSGGGTGGGTGSDTTPPTVTSVNPTDGAINVAVGADITITFSEDLAPSSVNASSITLSDGDASQVEAAVTLSGNVVTVNPNQNLRGGNTSYTLSISGSVTDLAGNAITAVNYGFSTINTPPTVVSSVPAADAENVSVDQTIEVTFSADLDPSTVNGTTVKLFYDNTLEQGGQVTVSGNKIIFNPSASMREFTTFYYLRISSGVKDVNNNTLTEEIRINFKSEPLVSGTLYTIQNPFSTNYLSLDNSTGNYRMTTKSTATTSLDFWRVIKVSTGVYIIKNHQAILSGDPNTAIEGAAPNDGNPILYTGMVDANTPFNGQRWQIQYGNTSSGGQRVHLIRHLSTGTFLNFLNLDIDSNAQTDAYRCVFVRF